MCSEFFFQNGRRFQIGGHFRQKMSNFFGLGKFVTKMFFPIFHHIILMITRIPFHRFTSYFIHSNLMIKGLWGRNIFSRWLTVSKWRPFLSCKKTLFAISQIPLDGLASYLVGLLCMRLGLAWLIKYSKWPLFQNGGHFYCEKDVK